MPTSREGIETIIATIPGFRPRWQKFLENWQSEETPLYLAMGEIAHYVVYEYEKSGHAQLVPFFSTVELVLGNADSELQDLICVGLFEDIQNIVSHRSFGQDVFRDLLGPQSLIEWNEVDRGMQKVAALASKQKPRWWQFWQRKGFDADAALSQVENPELRKIMEQIYRRKP
jgi:hypothetical protein